MHFSLFRLNPAQPAEVFYPDLLAGKGTAAARISAEERLAHDQPSLDRFLTGLTRPAHRLAQFGVPGPGSAPNERTGPVGSRDLQRQKEALETQLAWESQQFRAAGGSVGGADRRGAAPGRRPCRFCPVPGGYRRGAAPAKERKRWEKSLLAFIPPAGSTAGLRHAGGREAGRRSDQGVAKGVARRRHPSQGPGGRRLRGRLWEPHAGIYLAGATTILVGAGSTAILVPAGRAAWSLAWSLS